MLRPSALLSLLCIGATIVGAKLYVQRSLSAQAKGGSSQSLTPDETTLDYIAALEEELDKLRSDNDALRKLIEKESPLSLAPELIAFVEKDLELSFQQAPVALVRNQDALRDAAGQAWLSAFDEQQLAMLSYSFDVLGILPQDAQWFPQLIDAETIGSRGIYDPSTGEIALAEDFDAGNVHHQAALVRLLTIALLDQHYPLTEDVTFDHFISHRAMHHGRASMLQDRFYTIQARQIGFITERQPNTATAEFFAQLPVFVRNLVTFPNTFGKDYLNSLANKKSVSATLEATDLTTQLILLKNGRSSSPLSVDTALSLHTQLGALTLKSFCDQLNRENAAALTTQLQQDELSITTREDKEAITRWSLTFNTEESASAFVPLAKGVLALNHSAAKIVQNQQVVTLSLIEPLEVSE